MQAKPLHSTPLARAVPPKSPKGILKNGTMPPSPTSAPMVRSVSQPFRPSGSTFVDELTEAQLTGSSPYVATWLEAQKQREREWLCWHLRNERLAAPLPMPLPTAGTGSRPGTPPPPGGNPLERVAPRSGESPSEGRTGEGGGRGAAGALAAWARGVARAIARGCLGRRRPAVPALD